MTRRQTREQVFKLLFMANFYKEEELPEQFALFLSEDNSDKEEAKQSTSEEDAEITAKVDAIVAHLDEIDDKINQSTEGWKTSRMAKVDLTLIRIAVYEMNYEKLAEGIAINEAVEIAKKYGEENASSFVNGVLARLV